MKFPWETSRKQIMILSALFVAQKIHYCKAIILIHFSLTYKPNAMSKKFKGFCGNSRVDFKIYTETVQ